VVSSLGLIRLRSSTFIGIQINTAMQVTDVGMEPGLVREWWVTRRSGYPVASAGSS
jgi:hypothetical protein